MQLHARRPPHRRILTIRKAVLRTAEVPEFSLRISEDSKNVLREHFEKFPPSAEELRAASEDAGATVVQSLLPDDMQGSAEGLFGVS
jgi:hypothetical protein